MREKHNVIKYIYFFNYNICIGLFKCFCCRNRNDKDIDRKFNLTRMKVIKIDTFGLITTKAGVAAAFLFTLRLF